MALTNKKWSHHYAGNLRYLWRTEMVESGFYRNERERERESSFQNTQGKELERIEWTFHIRCLVV